MAFFDQIVEQLFPQKSGKNEILVHEPIKRSESFQEDYSRWVKSFKRVDLLKSVYSSYELKKQEVIGDPDVHLLQSNISNGFAVSYNDRIGKDDFVFFFDWLSEKTNQLDYRRTNSDVTVTARNNQIETLARYYYKPKISAGTTEKLIDQQYGNILIEHISIDDRPTYIRYIVNNYRDRKYTEAEDFEKLADFLFST
ncbi:MAG: hypothetical protein CMB80_28180 [Flammeovirgaceae bacterium]|nr:hypothetical protein [Flammeovirgaceae bacterium]MBE62358.1 hypothetical protein [Flammeovirgaceae bacterium]MBR09054.1 hypothetical protein [Rickettsiales bacterium]HCX23873.1 hypothetical protein [Cytophagales bacterium]|tara:strand:- start:150 stop:740 length:591 start_codon:yes stop_codon:yes gene_type:complete